MDRRFSVAISIAATLTILISCAYIFIPDTWSFYEKFTNHSYDFNSLIIVLTVLFAWKSIEGTKIHKLSWFLLWIGVTGWFLGDLAWTVMIYLGIDPFPSPADAFYIIGYAAVFAAVFSKFLRVRKHADKKDILNGIFVGGSLLAIASFAVLGPIIQSDYDIISKIIYTIYPVLDAVTITFAVIIISSIGIRKETTPWALICVGLTLWIIADTLNGYFEWSGIEMVAYWTDILFIGGINLIGLGAFYRALINKDRKKTSSNDNSDAQDSATAPNKTRLKDKQPSILARILPGHNHHL